ncbi:hypothetical protein A2W24_04450 [Microgenomates group bacterium RBG_16_45_19]|nr:MAG: hypothetical protein A2W24_04450 [Microgenomates group bacterium RBG_16_45_19]
MTTNGVQLNKGRILKYSRRYQIIRDYCRGKTVLDLGCVEHSAEAEQNFLDWIHRGIKEVAKEVVGLDNAPEEVSQLNRKGYNILLGDVENFDLQRRFEVVVCGELIEHVNNPGLLLQNAKKHLVEDGLLIITTPNCESAMWVPYIFAKGNIPCNPTHICWYSRQTLLELCHRYDLEESDTYYEVGNPTNRVIYYLERLIRRIRKSWAHELIVVFKNRPSATAFRELPQSRIAGVVR